MALRTAKLTAAVGLTLLLAPSLAWTQARPAPPPEDQLAAPGRPGWALDARSGCWLWNANPKPGETVAWTGECGAEGPAEGAGVREWRSDDRITSRYEGEIRNGKLNGRGVLTFPDRGHHYEGEFLDGRLIGAGVFVAANRARYEGEFRDGKFNGRGVLTFANDGRYEGEFRDGKLTGHGVVTTPSGYRYEGDLRDGKAHGRGMMTYPDGRRYGGKWRDGCLRAGGTWVAAVGKPLAECR